jgi:acetyl-CoA carboxylase carboxyltransferase component
MARPKTSSVGTRGSVHLAENASYAKYFPMPLMNMRELVADPATREGARDGAREIARRHERKKLTARERLERFFDDGVWLRARRPRHADGLAAGPDGTDKPVATQGVTAFGKSNGCMVLRRLRFHRGRAAASATPAR